MSQANRAEALPASELVGAGYGVEVEQGVGVGVGERTLRVVAEHADIWNTPGPPFLSAELIDAGVQQVILALQPPVRPAQWGGRRGHRAPARRRADRLTLG